MNVLQDTIIDGGGLVTLGRRWKWDVISTSTAPYFMYTDTLVVLQRLTLMRGSAPLGEFVPQNPASPECAYGYGVESGGGAIYMHDGRLHVLDSYFLDNQAALIGPGVAGGAIYVNGSKELVISGCTFQRNRAANGGAVGMLFCNPKIYNSVFEDNTAEGVGGNNFVNAKLSGDRAQRTRRCRWRCRSRLLRWPQ